MLFQHQEIIELKASKSHHQEKRDRKLLILLLEREKIKSVLRVHQLRLVLSTQTIYFTKMIIMNNSQDRVTKEEVSKE